VKLHVLERAQLVASGRDEARPRGTLVRDAVRRTLPLAPLGEIAHALVRRDLARVFDSAAGRSKPRPRDRATAAAPRPARPRQTRRCTPRPSATRGRARPAGVAAPREGRRGRGANPSRTHDAPIQAPPDASLARRPGRR